VLQIPASRTRTSAQPGRNFGIGLLTERNFPFSTWNASNREASFQRLLSESS